MSARRTLWPLVALYSAGQLAPYLLPTLVGRLQTGLPLTASQAGAVGSALLLCSAGTGFLLASRVERLGARRLARTGLTLAVLGYGTAALASKVPLVVAGALLGGVGSGTATAVAAAGIATGRDPHRTTTLGLFSLSAVAAVVYLTVPRLGPGHGTPFAAIALTALAAWASARRLPEPQPGPARRGPREETPLPHRRAGLLLLAAMPVWSLAQNALWGVSGRIGTVQAGLSESAVGVVFAAALGAGLLGVLLAGALGPRIGHVLPIGAGTVLIAGCVALSASARGPVAFATGETLWNLLYPFVMTYVIALSAALDPRGRWTVMVGPAGSLGTSAGPLTGSVLATHTGFPTMGLVLAAALLLAAVPLTAVARGTGRRGRPASGIPVGAGPHDDSAGPLPGIPQQRRKGPRPGQEPCVHGGSLDQPPHGQEHPPDDATPPPAPQD